MIMTLVVVLAELTLALLIILGLVAWKGWRRRSRERDAVQTLVTSIQSNQPARVEKLTHRLKSGGQLSDDDALVKADALIKQQNRFYQEAIDLYYSRNHEVLSRLDHRLEALIEQYGATFGAQPAAAEPGANAEAIAQLSRDVAAMSKDIEKLRTENTELHRQLKAAEQELDQLGREYVSAFNRQREAAAGAVPAAAAAATAAADAIAPPPPEPIPAVTPAESEAAPTAKLADGASDQGLLADLDLSELVGKDAGPATTPSS